MPDDKKNLDGSKDIDNVKPGEGGGGEGGGDDKTFDEAYVKTLRGEAAQWRTKFQGVNKQVSELQAKLDSIDVEKYQALVENEAKAEEEAAKAAGDFDKLKEKMTSAHAEEVQALNLKLAEGADKAKALEAELHRTILQNAIANEAAKAKAINPRLVEMAVMSEASIEKTDDGNRIIRLKDEFGEVQVNPKDGKPMTIAQRVAEMKQSSEYAHLFEGGSAGSGSGTFPSKGGKPDFSKMTPTQRLAWERQQMLARA